MYLFFLFIYFLLMISCFFSKDWLKSVTSSEELSKGDPFVTVRLKSKPFDVKNTTCKARSIHPVWKETFILGIFFIALHSSEIHNNVRISNRSTTSTYVNFPKKKKFIIEFQILQIILTRSIAKKKRCKLKSGILCPMRICEKN